VLNGRTVPLDTPLQEGDTVAAFSAIAGGGEAGKGMPDSSVLESPIL